MGKRRQHNIMLSFDSLAFYSKSGDISEAKGIIESLNLPSDLKTYTKIYTYR